MYYEISEDRGKIEEMNIKEKDKKINLYGKE
jgi:hypothetical protein